MGGSSLGEAVVQPALDFSLVTATRPRPPAFAAPCPPAHAGGHGAAGDEAHQHIHQAEAWC